METLEELKRTKLLDPCGKAVRLKAIDWTFGERKTAPAIESIHPYPAKFIGEIPRALISTLGVPAGTSILDPFCGSGTTLLEAQRAGVSSVGIDLNPIACLISRVKTSPLISGFGDAVTKVIAEAIHNRAVVKPDIPNVDHWFKRDVQQAVSSLATVIQRPAYEPWFDQLRLALSSILVRVSNQDSDTRYAAVDKNVSFSSVFESFTQSANKLERALLARSWSLHPARVVEGNTLDVTCDDVAERVGLVITSPPYPNAYEYWLYHKYRMWWLGFDPISVRDKEIGARAHFFKKNAHTAEVFNSQMAGVFKLVSDVMVNDGYVCFVVGRSKIHGQLVDNGNIIEDVAASHGFSKVERVERLIRSSRKSFNLSHANIKTESVLVFHKS